MSVASAETGKNKETQQSYCAVEPIEIDDRLLEPKCPNPGWGYRLWLSDSRFGRGMTPEEIQKLEQHAKQETLQLFDHTDILSTDHNSQTITVRVGHCLEHLWVIDLINRKRLSLEGKPKGLQLASTFHSRSIFHDECLIWVRDGVVALHDELESLQHAITDSNSLLRGIKLSFSIPPHRKIFRIPVIY